jgi:hypothetical protein
MFCFTLYPLLFTIFTFNAVWGIIESAVNNPKYGKDYAGVIWDILQISRNCPTKKWPTGCLFQVVITSKATNSSLILLWPYSEFHTWFPFHNTNLFPYQVYYRGRSEKDIHLQNRMRSGGSGGAGLDNHAAGGRLN